MLLPFVHKWHGRSPTLVILACVAAIGHPQWTVAEELPETRPALVGSSKDALINRIDTQKLIKNGQGDSALMFYCGIESSGQVAFFETYRVTPGGEKLKNEVTRCLYQAIFIPAVYNHRKVPAMLYGTVMFMVIDGRPRLRIFSNQELSELKKEADFIAPQSVFIPNHRRDFVPYPSGPWASENQPGTVELSLSVAGSGNLKDVHVVKETPPGRKFGEVAVKAMQQNTYIPAFHNGQPVDSTTHIHFTFTRSSWYWR